MGPSSQCTLSPSSPHAQNLSPRAAASLIRGISVQLRVYATVRRPPLRPPRLRPAPPTALPEPAAAPPHLPTPPPPADAPTSTLLPVGAGASRPHRLQQAGGDLPQTGEPLGPPENCASPLSPSCSLVVGICLVLNGSAGQSTSPPLTAPGQTVPPLASCWRPLPALADLFPPPPARSFTRQVASRGFKRGRQLFVTHRGRSSGLLWDVQARLRGRHPPLTACTRRLLFPRLHCGMLPNEVAD